MRSLERIFVLLTAGLLLSAVILGCRPVAEEPGKSRTAAVGDKGRTGPSPAARKPVAEDRAAQPEKADTGVKAGDGDRSIQESAKAEAEDRRAPDTRQEFTRDLGPPLVEGADNLKRLHPKFPVWLDSQNKQVVLVGAVCNRNGPLELLACLQNTKEYESLVTINTTAQVVQAGLLAAGAEAGKPVTFQPEYAPPQGPVIEVTLVWNDAKGQRQTAPAQHWIRRQGSSEAMQHPWVFTGSHFVPGEEQGRQVFAADATGDLISVANFRSSVLDVPTRSTQSDAELLFEAYTDRIPPRGTAVTVILKPGGQRAAQAKDEKTVTW